MAQITANGTYGPYQWRGGGGTLVTSGNFDSGTVQLQYSLDDGLTFTSYPGISQTSPGVTPFNISGAVVLQVDVSGGDVTNSMDFFLQVNDSDGATNLGTISVAGTGLASEATALNIATDVAELKELSFGNNGVTVVKSATAYTGNAFRGLQVLSDITITTIAGGDWAHTTDLDGEVLTPGYHPISGNASVTITVGGSSGLAYLVHE